MIEITLNNQQQIIDMLAALERGVTYRVPLMRRLAGTMQSAVDQNFAEGGRPKWLGIKYREGKPLIKTGALRQSINASWDNNEALVGTNLEYAALHQFGGTIRPKNGKYLKFKTADGWRSVKEVTIQPRPFLTLTAQDEADLLDDIQDYFQKLIK